MPLAQAHPANSSGQPLEADSRARHVEPMMQMWIIGNQFFDLGVGLVDVFRVARQRHPAERADAATEQGSYVFRHEAWNLEGLRDPGIEGDLPDVVAIVEYRQSSALEAQQVFDV